MIVTQAPTRDTTDRLGRIEAEQLAEIVSRWGRPFVLDRSGYRHLESCGLDREEVHRAVNYSVAARWVFAFPFGGKKYLAIGSRPLPA